MHSGFSLSRDDQVATPIIVSVPHAGRLYPAQMRDQCRLSVAQLRCLEDRYAEVLAAAVAEAGHGVLIADIARAWIDLNRDEDELDATMVMSPHALPSRMTAKVRGGLGLIPRRIAQGGDIWKGPLSADDITERVEQAHRPYHRALERALAERHRRFGVAILIDLHSMPPLRASGGVTPPHIVIGNLHGQAADPRLTDAALHEVTCAGFRAALNAPYAGGHILQRHASPRRGVHALQIEVDRSLYLDAAFDLPGKGAATIAQLILRIAEALSEEALGPPLAIAAE